MDKQINYTQDQAERSKNELQQWETPQLHISNIENITEGGTDPNPVGDDGFYQS